MRASISTIVALLVASASLAVGQSTTLFSAPATLTTVTSSRTTQAAATTKLHSSIVSASSSPTPTTRESAEYYPAGTNYDDSDDPTGLNSDADGGGAGKSDAFMGGGLGAQIGIITAVVVIALALFIGTIIYYFHRRKQWEREVKRRSALPMNAKIIIGRNGEVRLAERSSTASKVGAEELEKGGHKVPKIEGEVKPNMFNMLLGKF